jgi:antitoxin CptB
MENKENYKKQIIYRSTHRGSKEMDLLLGSFVKDNIENLNDEDLLHLKTLVETDDEILKIWYYSQESKHPLPKNKIFNKFRNFQL